METDKFIPNMIKNCEDNNTSCIFFEKDPVKRRIIMDSTCNSRKIISYGLIVYAIDINKWILVQRKHSVEFLLFIRGTYRLTLLPFILTAFTQHEVDLLKRFYIDNDYLLEFINKELDLDEENTSYALTRFKDSKKIVQHYIEVLDFSKNALQWTWPKGRINVDCNLESGYECAIREFKDEVEIDLSKPKYLSENYFTENILTVSGRNIESRYWLYIIDKHVEIPKITLHDEVSDRRWCDENMCRNVLTSIGLFNEILTAVKRFS